MLNKINGQSIVKSFYLGVLIGLGIQIYLQAYEDLFYFILSLMFSGIVGLIIGTVTEVITSLFPISIAKPKTYFFINNCVAVGVTAMLFIIGQTYLKSDLSSDVYFKLIGAICAVVAVANVLDYLNYKRTNKKLMAYKKSIERPNK